MRGGPMGVLVSLAVFGLIVFVAYRQLKSVFAVVHALKIARSDRPAFKESLLLTEGKWWRTF